jgi:hypothetical protein
MLRRALAGLAVMALLGFSSVPASPSLTAQASPSPLVPSASIPATVPSLDPTLPLGLVLQPPPRNRIATDLPTVADARLWLSQTLPTREAVCLDRIVWHESRWNPLVWNTKGSGAYGLPQARPASKMASAGPDYMTNPITQLRWAIAYAAKYGSLCGAWAFWVAHGWW